MLRFIKSFSFAFLLLCIFSIVSCKSIRQPDSIPQPLNYSDEDIVQNEIERIDGFLESEPLRALWRAGLLGRKEVLESKSFIIRLSKKKNILMHENTISRLNL